MTDVRAEAAPKPVPVPDDRSEPYWTAAARGELALQRCQHCGRFSHPPVPVCAGCFTVPPSFAFETVSGRGKVTTWTVFRQTFLPGFRDDVPYVVVVAELDAQPGLQLLGRLVDGADAPLEVGAPVRVVFEEVGPDRAVPAFTLTEVQP